MKVARIEIFGFKSFMDRLVLPLEAGVTGVVGPNGCGKSNVVDALRWVLGETRASSLRGDLLEDVIFNGTENLRPLGLAEVTLTLRSAGADFFADLINPLSEQEVETQSLVQDLDKAASRVLEYSKIEEEEVSESAELQSETPERPKLKVIKGSLGSAAPEAQSGSSAAPEKQQNISYLSRFSWLKSCNEVQVTRRIYRSGESEFFINRVPCRLKDMKDLFRALGLGARAYTIVAQGEVSRIVSAKPEERRLIIEEAAGVSGFRDKIQTARRRLEDTAVNISRLDDLITEVSRQVSVLKRQAQRARDRQTLKDSIAVIDKMLFSVELFDFNGKISQAEKALEQARLKEQEAESGLNLIQAEEHEARSSLMTIDVATDEVRARIDAIREELNNRSEKRSSGESKINELKAYAVAAATEQERISQNLLTLDKRKASCLQDIDKLQAAEKELAAKLGECERFINGEEIPALAKEIDDLKVNLRNSERQVSELREELALQKGAMEQIRAQIVSGSPLNQLKNTLRSQGALLPEGLEQEMPILADLLEAEPAYAQVLQAILAEKAEFILAEDPHQIAQVFLKNKSNLPNVAKEGAFGLGLFKFDPQRVSVVGHEQSRYISEEFPPVLSLISTKYRDNALVYDLLQGYYLIDDAEQAFDYFNTAEHDQNITFVTPAGDIIGKDLFSSFRHEAGTLSLRQKEDDLQRSCNNLTALLQGLEDNKLQLTGQIESKETEQAELLLQVQQKQKQSREIGNQHAGALGRLESEKRVLAQIEEDLKTAQFQQEALADRIEKYRVEEAAILVQLQALVSEDDSHIRDNLEKLKNEHARLDTLRKEGHRKLSDAASKLDDSRKALDSARSAVSHFDLDLQKYSIEEKSLLEKISSTYGEQLLMQLRRDLNLFLLPSEDEITEARTEASRLKARLLREGEADFSSIERFEEENERLESLKKQKNDLQNASDTLRRTIDMLVETSKARFMATFRAITKNFSNLIPRLFGGGKGDLQLIDPDNPLETGIEIIVRPPGKKIRSIDLLSGGEKALSATALIFAMFLERPSPLCVLDEVDAPLDDANLVRLIALIKEMSKKTQFILITHNKQSMVASDNLIGVTMQEPGASKVISVSLQEAFSQVA